MEGTKLFSKRLGGKDPERMAIVGGGRSCTYGDFYRGIRGLSHTLRDMGVAKGSRLLSLTGLSPSCCMDIDPDVMDLCQVDAEEGEEIRSEEEAEETAFIILTS